MAGMQTGKVTRPDVLNFLTANGVQVLGIVLGGKPGISRT
jgi:hypothetical protein